MLYQDKTRYGYGFKNERAYSGRYLYSGTGDRRSAEKSRDNFKLSGTYGIGGFGNLYRECGADGGRNRAGGRHECDQCFDSRKPWYRRICAAVWNTFLQYVVKILQTLEICQKAMDK